MTSLRWRTAQHFEKIWWKNYLGNKEPGDYLIWKQNYWIEFLEKIINWVEPLSSQRFLDMGCGPAGIFMVLPGIVAAVDPLLEDYKTHLPHFEPDKYENVTFFSSRAEDFDCDGQFDIVFCLNVINHVTDIRKVVKTLYNCCKSGGKLVVSADAHTHGFLRSLFRYLHFDILHPYQLTLNEYRKLLESEGFLLKGEKCLRKGFIFDYVVIVADKA